MAVFTKRFWGRALLYAGCVLGLALSLYALRGAITVVQDRYDQRSIGELYSLALGRYYEKRYVFYDDFFLEHALHKHVEILYGLRTLIWLILPLSLLFLGLCLRELCRTAGREPGRLGRLSAFLNKLPLEMYLFVMGAGCLLLTLPLYYGSENFFYRIHAHFMPLVLTGILLLPALISGLTLRIKQGKLWENSLLARLLRILPLVWKSLLFGLLLGLAVIGILLHTTGGFLYDLWPQLAYLIPFFLLLTAFFVYLALGMRRLEQGAARLAEGDLESRIDLHGLLPDFRRHGENLNRMGEGLEAALKERMKAEHSKAELITNVTHDIRTPLTSLINYAALLEKEESDNPKVGEYAAVIRRQSRRLERLTEDLVEATQAASGTLSVELAPCDAAMLLSQAMGEYEDRLKQAGLTPLLRLPEASLMIQADGRRMWRIFDNLLGNICKYAQPGTRVYGELRREGEEAVFAFKNTSREPLPEQVEELTARFVRGDASRHTAGSGLGLSIADSLARLQSGTLKLSADGDLFKAEVRFRAEL